MSYLIYNGELLAKTKENLISGSKVRWSHTITRDTFNANRDNALVNAEYATVSNAKKWDKKYTEDLAAGVATLINYSGLYPEYKI